MKQDQFFYLIAMLWMILSAIEFSTSNYKLSILQNIIGIFCFCLSFKILWGDRNANDK